MEFTKTRDAYSMLYDIADIDGAPHMGLEAINFIQSLEDNNWTSFFNGLKMRMSRSNFCLAMERFGEIWGNPHPLEDEEDDVSEGADALLSLKRKRSTPSSTTNQNSQMIHEGDFQPSPPDSTTAEDEEEEEEEEDDDDDDESDDGPPQDWETMGVAPVFKHEMTLIDTVMESLEQASQLPEDDILQCRRHETLLVRGPRINAIPVPAVVVNTILATFNSLSKDPLIGKPLLSDKSRRIECKKVGHVVLPLGFVLWGMDGRILSIKTVAHLTRQSRQNFMSIFQQKFLTILDSSFRKAINVYEVDSSNKSIFLLIPRECTLPQMKLKTVLWQRSSGWNQAVKFSEKKARSTFQGPLASLCQMNRMFDRLPYPEDFIAQRYTSITSMIPPNIL
jgi:hypothetical protein